MIEDNHDGDKMKKLLLIISVAMVYCTGCAQTIQSSLQKAYNATAEVYVQLTPTSPWASMGTSWLVNNQRTFVTAKHVVGPRDLGSLGTVAWAGIKLKLSDGTFVPVRLSDVHSAENSDIAILIIRKDVKKAFVPLKFATKTPQVGDEVCGVGYPLTYDQVAFTGRLTGITWAGDPHYLTNAVINPGHSGSAAVNLNGEVIGMVVAGDRRTESINYVLPAFLIQEYLKKVVK